MSTLNSASSLAEIKAAYFDNASYSEDADVAKARAFITACRCLLMKIPRRVARGGPASEEIEMEPRLLMDQIAEAKKWLTDNAPSSASDGAVRFSDFSNFRA
jgi:hypothetical protein